MLLPNSPIEIREAKFGDIRDLVSLCAVAHKEFGHDGSPFCPDTTRNTFQRAVNQREAVVLILTDGEDVHGVLVGVVNQLWYSRKRQASDLFFYVRPEYRGHGGGLISRFLGWARKQPRVAEVVMGVTSGADTEERFGRALAPLGFVRTGGYYQLNIGEGGNVDCS